ncbi:8846_t:CDS:2, partial [Scutellospora calospora]
DQNILDFEDRRPEDRNLISSSTPINKDNVHLIMEEIAKVFRDAATEANARASEAQEQNRTQGQERTQNQPN